MIKLTLNPHSDKEIKQFQKNLILIGSCESADISLPGENLEPSHIKIEQKADDYYIINVANDPFTTLNGMPFGKKKLANNDVIQIGNTDIQFNTDNNVDKELRDPPSQTDAIKTTPQEHWLDTSEEKLQELIENKIHEKSHEPSLASHNFSPSNNNIADSALNTPSSLDDEYQEEDIEEESYEENAWEDSELQELINEVNQLELEQEFAQESPQEESTQSTHLPQPPVPPIILKDKKNLAETTSTITPQKNHKGSLKDAYLSEFDDESESWNQHKKKSPIESTNPIKANFKTIGIALSAFLIIFISTLLILFFHLRAKHIEDELDAAEGIADIAMALSFAQLNHVKPLNQNWSDPDFLKNNLMAVLASEYSPAYFFENHGQFRNNEYSLRIYSSADLSQFLIIAQPSPNLLQWLVPKASILVDSKSMELRRTTDLKSLNRLLLNPNTLEGMNAVEVNNLIKQGEIISFHSMSRQGKDLGYIFAKAMSLVRPGAENAIYNAPRYYPFSETFLRKALMITDNFINPYERSLIQEEIRQLDKYPNLVLYTTKGLKWLQKAQKAMSILYPTNHFLYATIQLNPQGKIIDSHLLMENKSSSSSDDEDLAELTFLMEQGEQNDLFEIEFNDANDDEMPSPFHEIPDHTPVTYQGKTSPETQRHLYKDAQRFSTSKDQDILFSEFELKKLFETKHHEDILLLLKNLENLLRSGESRYHNDPLQLEKNQAAISFIAELTRIMQQYQEAKKQNTSTSTTELNALREPYSDMPEANFLAYTKAVGTQAQETPHPDIATFQPTAIKSFESEIQAHLSHIENSEHLQELERNVTRAVSLITFDKVSDTKKLVYFQNEIHYTVLEKLNAFLLSNEKTLPNKEFIAENRPILANILKTAWVIDPDEFDFYLNEFDLRLQELSTSE